MLCTLCNEYNDDDAAFCVRCGEPLEGEQEGTVPRQRTFSPYFVILAIAFFSLIGLGYYKFFLPQGVVAVVNGEVITRAELDAAVQSRMKALENVKENRAVAGERGSRQREGVRYAVLSEMIRERILLQEARKARVHASQADVGAAVSGMRLSSGREERAFRRSITERYGSFRAFEMKLERDLTINKLIADSVAPGITDPAQRQAAIESWFHDVSDRATVRITLPEQWSGANHGCCSGNHPFEDDGRHRGMECRGAPERIGPAEGQRSAAATGEHQRTNRSATKP